MNPKEHQIFEFSPVCLLVLNVFIIDLSSSLKMSCVAIFLLILKNIIPLHLYFWVGFVFRLSSPAFDFSAITAIHGISRGVSSHVNIFRRKGCLIESSNPSPHGGRGALPSEGGSPSDLLFLAGGGSKINSFIFF
ncbi:hypothetical protein N665_0845s0017 [Sinapis alba]|nr:hypothetical protein N665_0845s0017 [Sinapis alba]